MIQMHMASTGHRKISNRLVPHYCRSRGSRTASDLVWESQVLLMEEQVVFLGELPLLIILKGCEVQMIEKEKHSMLYRLVLQKK